MYYIVKHNKKTYVSKEIVKHLYKIGDAGLVRETANGNLKIVQLLSVNLFDIPKDKIAQLDVESMGIIVQDLDAELKKIKPVTEASKMITSAKGCITWCFGNPETDQNFIRLSDLVYARKYQIQEDIPCIDICGTRYVAVNATKKDSDTYISL